VKPPNKYGETLEYNHLGNVEKLNAKLNDINIKWLSLERTVDQFVNTPAVLSGYETWTWTRERTSGEEDLGQVFDGGSNRG
jgi:hypothetical protein